MALPLASHCSRLMNAQSTNAQVCGLQTMADDIPIINEIKLNVKINFIIFLIQETIANYFIISNYNMILYFI